MIGRIARAAAICLAPALAGCTAPAAPAVTHRVVFVCPDHAPITVLFQAGTAMLMAGGPPAHLAVQPSGSGFRYAGDGQALRGKGGALEWTDSAGTRHACEARDWPAP